MIRDGGGSSNTSSAAAKALQKLQTSGANSLTASERTLLGMGPKPGPSSVLDFINQANTFTPGVPASLAPPPPPPPPASNNSQAERDREAQAQRDRDAQAQRDRDAQAQRDRDAQAQADRDAQAQRDRDAAQAESNRLAAEQAERDRIAAEQAEAARLEALARMPKPLVVSAREPVKYATPSDVLIDINDMPVDLILKLTLEKIGGIELINLVRHDTVNGQNIIYRPVKNISQLAIDYNPQNMVKMPDSADSYFKNFSIKLENHIQQTTNELPPLVAYIDLATGNVIIDVVATKADYEIEVQMVSSGKVFDATIYEEDNS